MELDALRNHSAESNGNSVADVPPLSFKCDFAVAFREAVVPRKRLEQRCFSERERSVLFGVAESAASNVVTECRYRWAKLIPSHPAVYRAKRFSCPPPMTLQDQR